MTKYKATIDIIKNITIVMLVPSCFFTDVPSFGIILDVLLERVGVGSRIFFTFTEFVFFTKSSLPPLPLFIDSTFKFSISYPSRFRISGYWGFRFTKWTCECDDAFDP